VIAGGDRGAAREPRGRFPPQIRYLAWNEGCERFSYYGMASILTVHMVQRLFFTEAEAESRFHLFVFAVYATPLLGAFIADRFLGRYRVVLWLSLGYVAGHATIAAFGSRLGLAAGLCLVAVGAGGIKPCAAAFVGDQFGPGSRHLLKRVYDLYYWMINLGSTTSTLLIPVLYDRYGPPVAFAVPGLLMAGALLVFWAGRKGYLRLPPTGPNPHGFVRVVKRALQRLGTGRAGEHWLDGALDRHPREAVEGTRAVFRILGIFAPVAAFWALFFQYGSSWVLQAEKLDRRLLGHEVLPSQVPSVEPILILILIPIFAGWLYPWLARRGLEPTALRKMQAGMFATVLSFACATALQAALDLGGRPSVAWQLLPYLLLAVGEVLVSITALEFAYTQAPPAMKSTIMGLWYVTIALGNLLTAWVASLNRFHGAWYYAFFTALMLAGALLFAAVARRYRPVEWPAATPAPEAASG
jgi:POT family proton-dependent oligopeptide transporter